MKDKLKNGIALSLLPQILLVAWLGGRPDLVEAYYSNGIYPPISQFFRILFGWLPFSIGEILYALLIVLGLRYLYKNRLKIKKRPLLFLRNVVVVLSVFYFTFNLVWGLNYYRKPIAENFAIRDSVQTSEVVDLAERLILRTNQLQFELTADSTKRVEVPYSREEIFDKTVEGYRQLELEYPFLEYRHSSLKASMFSTLASYMGIGGYLNPFTNEAQVNATTPLFRFPVVSAHEVGHQVGYSKENETNFIGYLVTLRNDDTYFQYSASAYALSHCLSAVRRSDEALFQELYAKLNFGVQENYRELYEHSLKYVNPFEPIFKSVFNTFLKANQQKDGIKSYGKIVELMVGYHEKHPL
ncbi:DUF3810 domain-containing protein [Zobellia galactanivorans]|uniref:Conserved hypothetical membrane protein n=1 Tax=Zobellia galactanivorans (strain DSM 12802 / CCUG 47099 / CIP 106680 / NCIMB 13871 / Dsij) TaxID=63186 RepID=G0L1Q7_ZOBGA|nr:MULTISPECIES: DUF3810 domain-containing protein [Zobellia]MBU3024355.1 DUF3810 domain-containing protein [Zobellia galactanivorans]MDO6807462.1 DUF3810 domain-containing protein [Zobellia galactanivorans]OWW24172.1 amino acid permease [Zobellia sp. OII3]CAZ97844.1 Conserved hypothetical membrane protein [Zobellia galactanivorans]